ncbi:flagellar motor switch protein FliM [Desemzia sp. FAM 24101]|uniref:flagellar motor switch protein FliM n=1 Tax=unclassified Desemzia TaxID=2685243 RepID=UPI00388A464A
MKQVLSQQEIDSLLEAVQSGEIDSEELEEAEKPKIKAYDFKRPVRLSKEYISTLTMIFEEFAKIVGNQLTTQVRSNVSLQLASIEQVSFEEFIHSVPRFTWMNVFHSNPLEGVQVVELNPQVTLQMIELLCGSSEIIESKDFLEKESFTEIELAILEEVSLSFKKAFKTSWAGIIELDTELEAMETNPQLLQSMSPNEPVVLTTFTVTLLGNQSFMNLCIPYVFFEKILDKLSFRNWFHTEKGNSDLDNEKLENNLQAVQVNTEVMLGKTQMTLDNFLQLEVGDIIQLDGKTSQPLVMSVENLPSYLVKPGLHGKNLAVEVLENIGGETS